MIECFAFIRFISGVELLTFAPGFSKLFGTQGASSSDSLLNESVESSYLLHQGGHHDLFVCP